MAHQIPLISASMMQSFAEISELLGGGTLVKPTAADNERVVRRGIGKLAPLHLQKNSVADALLIELYASLLAVGEPRIDRYCFATSNYQDFSVPGGDRQVPHADIADYFPGKRSRYAYGVDGLREALADYFDERFAQEAAEVQLLHTDPRTYGEILAAETELADKISHVRKLIVKEKAEVGEREALSPAQTSMIEASMHALE
jgi:hypothetical protein